MVDNEICTARIQVFWTIKNVSRKRNFFHESEIFKTLIGWNEIEWCLRFKWNEYNIFFGLLPKTDITSNFSIIRKLKILGKDNEVIHKFRTNYDSSNECKKNEANGWKNCILKGISDKYDKYDSILTFCFKLKLRMNIESLICNKKFLHNTQLFNSSEYSDFTCISSDEKKFPIHRCILATQSSVFDKMFKADMSENKTNAVKIDDIDGDTLLEFLRFIYTGQVQNVKELASPLMYAAEKYEINELKKLCTLSLIENLSLKNVLETLILADFLNENCLLNECLELISKKYNELRDNEVWENIKHRFEKKLKELDSENPIEYVQSSKISYDSDSD